MGNQKFLLSDSFLSYFGSKNKTTSLKKAKRRSYDTQIVLTTFSKINQIQNIIEISI
jgi:hypothetical protein